MSLLEVVVCYGLCDCVAFRTSSASCQLPVAGGRFDVVGVFRVVDCGESAHERVRANTLIDYLLPLLKL